MSMRPATKSGNALSTFKKARCRRLLRNRRATKANFYREPPDVLIPTPADENTCLLEFQLSLDTCPRQTASAAIPRDAIAGRSVHHPTRRSICVFVTPQSHTIDLLSCGIHTPCNLASRQAITKPRCLNITGLIVVCNSPPGIVSDIYHLPLRAPFGQNSTFSAFLIHPPHGRAPSFSIHCSLAFMGAAHEQPPDLQPTSQANR